MAPRRESAAGYACLLWWDSRNRALNDPARSAIEDPENAVFVSTASVWEIAIKHRFGKLGFEGSAAAAIGANGFRDLPLTSANAEAAGDLAWQHSDLFDRVLVTQAIRLGLTLVTADRQLRTFDGVATLWGARTASA